MSWCIQARESIIAYVLWWNTGNSVILKCVMLSLVVFTHFSVQQITNSLSSEILGHLTKPYLLYTPKPTSILWQRFWHTQQFRVQRCKESTCKWERVPFVSEPALLPWVCVPPWPPCYKRQTAPVRMKNIPMCMEITWPLPVGGYQLFPHLTYCEDCIINARVQTLRQRIGSITCGCAIISRLLGHMIALLRLFLGLSKRSSLCLCLLQPFFFFIFSTSMC